MRTALIDFALCLLLAFALYCALFDPGMAESVLHYFTH